MKNEMVLEEIREAEKEVANAEGDLARLLKEVEIAPRAEKTTISEALRAALRKLRDGRAHLVMLEKLVRDSVD